MLIVRADLEVLRKLKEEDRFANWPDMLAWVKSLADSGNHVGGAPLAIGGGYVSMNEVLSDGPFIESKESVIGYDIILADDIEAAVSIAQTCPMVMNGLAVREVRPIHFPEEFSGD